MSACVLEDHRGVHPVDFLQELLQDGIAGDIRKKLPAKPQDPRLEPTYSIEEAARYLQIAPSTLRSWAVGRRKKDGQGFYEPVLKFVEPSTQRLSFYDLVEAHLLKFAVGHIPMKQLRRGLDFLRRANPRDPRPLLTQSFRTDGKYLLLEGMLGSKRTAQKLLINASVGGQLEMAEMIEPHVKTLASEIDKRIRLLVWDRSKKPVGVFLSEGTRAVSITPGVISGRPVIEGTRIPTAIVAQRNRAGESIASLARDYRLTRDKIEAAIQYETATCAA